MKGKKILGAGAAVIVGVVILGGLFLANNSDKSEDLAETEEHKAVKEDVEVVVEESNEVIDPVAEANELYVGDIGEWIKEAIAILDGDLDDPRIEQSGNDEGFEIYLKSRAIQESLYNHEIFLSKKVLDEIMEEKPRIYPTFDSDLGNLQLMQTAIGHFQFVRTAHLGSEGQAIEAVEFAEQWEEPPKEMLIAFDYMRQLLHDLDVAFNHNGKGEAFGVSYTLGGENIKDLETTERWSFE